MTNIIPIIVSGGQGTRLWPLSRASMPKQFIPFMSGQSLFELTLERLSDHSLFQPPIIVCAKDHRFHIVDILKEKNVSGATIVCELVGRNTAAALCAGILAAKAKGQTTDDTQFLMLPSDHYIPDHAAFYDGVRNASMEVSKGHIATFGINPRSPHIGFGYIEKGHQVGAGFSIQSFKEKPDLATAKNYLETGRYFWNAGIFLIRQGDFLNALQEYQPDILASVTKAWEKAEQDLGDYILDLDSFSACPDISFDHAVMEKTDRAWVMPAGFLWDDLGSWDALWDVSKKDENGNATEGDVIVQNTHNTYLRSDKQLLCAIGVRDIVAVATDDAIVILPRGQSEQIKSLVGTLKSAKRPELYQGGDIYRPWGHYQILMSDPGFKLLRILVLPGHRFSLHKHNHRTEHWMVVRGQAHVIKDGESFELKTNDSIYLPRGSLHRMENLTDDILEVIEVQSGDYLGEDDMIRVEDDYNRTINVKELKTGSLS